MATLRKRRARRARPTWQGIMPTTFKMTRMKKMNAGPIHPPQSRKMDESVRSNTPGIATSAMNTILYKLARLLL
ncbi:hypothetical protein [Chromobacterium violaceum]|uniref:hypothetical protein n=1 Tax=Chromobacterium violaceum TaxID=536 RepID=UPI003CF1FA29